MTGSRLLAVEPLSKHPSVRSLEQLEHEYSIREELDPDWAAQPIALERRDGRMMLLLEDPGGEPLDSLLGRPLELMEFLRLAVALAGALGKLHAAGLIHKNIRPANILAEAATGNVWLTGFGLASRLRRERQAPERLESLSTLAYLAPEQTGRMNRSIDSRSDLYSYGIILYEMLTGAPPFTVSEPTEWVHAHIARRPIPPRDRVEQIPETISAIVMKLLAKASEERYQTAAGVEADLKRCLGEIVSLSRIDPFPLGAHDVSDQLLIPERLYGPASQAAISLDNARLYADLTQENSDRKRAEQAVRAGQEELNRLNRTLQTLYQCNRALIHATDEQELFQSVCQILVDVGRLRLAWVGQCENDAAKTVRPVAKAGYGVDYLEHVKVSWGEETETGRGPVGIALRTGKPCWIKDARIDPGFAPWRTDAIARGYVSCVTLPLIADGNRLGNLSLYAAEPNAFNESTIEQYTDLANNLAYGVTALRTREERKRAEEKTREHAVKLSQANEVLKHSLNALARDKNLHNFVDQVLVVITEQLGSHSSTLWLIDVVRRKGYLHLVCQDGRVVAAQHSDHPNAREPHEWSSDDPGWIALQMKRPFVHYDAVNNPQATHTPARRACFSAPGVESLVWIPLVFSEQLIGMLSVGIAVNRQIDDEDLEFAQALAQQVTLALELARLAEQAKQSALVVERERAARERAAELAKANEALLECLDALAAVPELDEFLGQVMVAITRQLGATSSALRWCNHQQECLTLDFVFQDGRVMTPAEVKYPEHLQSIPLDERQVRMLKKPATVMHLLDNFAAIPDSHRSYLLGLGAKTLLIIPLVIARQLIGSLTFRFTEDREFRPEEIEIARALASQASLAIQLTRLAKAARQSAVLAERNELAGEIHDSLAQFFTGISMQLGAAREVSKAGGGSVLSYLERASDLAQFGLAETRRSAFSLQPTIIEESGLIEALQRLVERSNIPGRLRCNFHSAGVPEESLPSSVQQDLLRIAQEAMSNAVRHAKPTVISVNLRCNPPNIVLEVTDNGSGIADSQASSREGFGFSNMRTRAENIGAQLEVRSAAGRGTSIVVHVPMNF